MEYKIHIQLGERVQTFTTSFYRKADGYIIFTDKFGQPKQFKETICLGIEEVRE